MSMIRDIRDITYYKGIANDLFIPMVLEDYGSENEDSLFLLTDTIAKLYMCLNYKSFSNVIVYTPLDPSASLLNIPGINPIPVISYQNLAPLSGNNIVIEVRENGDIFYSINVQFDINTHRQFAIIYNLINTTLCTTEIFYGISAQKKLASIPNSDSYFAIQTFKDLDLALEYYATKFARHSEMCGFLKDVWADSNKIFFRTAPEHILRDSLTQFLQASLRDTEVRPEQIVDRSHPVDIKVTWGLTSHLALIEIKWLGKSLQTSPSKTITQTYSQGRALEGAKQLSDYLDANRIQAALRTTKGYLVVFDARRWGCTENTTTISHKHALWYVNAEIVYNPEYHKTRTDFAKPFRFFMEPKI